MLKTNETPYISKLDKPKFYGLKLWINESISFVGNTKNLCHRTIYTYEIEIYKNFNGYTLKKYDSSDKLIYKRSVKLNVRGIDYATMRVLLSAEFGLDKGV